MYVLDTDSITHLFQDHSPMLVKMEHAVARQQIVAITIISKIEILQGRMAALLKADTHPRFLNAQKRLLADEQRIRQMRLLLLDESALSVFSTLTETKGMKKVGRADLLIASIVRANHATLETRNLKHFKLIPHLACENWVD